MSPGKVRLLTVMQKSTLVDTMLVGLSTLPLTSLEAFNGDARDVAAAERSDILLDIAGYPELVDGEL